MDRLAIKRCRELGSNPAEGISDEQMLAIRDMLYEFASIMIDAYEELKPIDVDTFSRPVASVDVSKGQA